MYMSVRRMRGLELSDMETVDELKIINIEGAISMDSIAQVMMKIASIEGVMAELSIGEKTPNSKTGEEIGIMLMSGLQAIGRVRRDAEAQMVDERNGEPEELSNTAASSTSVKNIVVVYCSWWWRVEATLEHLSGAYCLLNTNLA
eukprot:m.28081 g.28081  ORF g.28081 m.28081 type:complete len:145 (+) comp11808_c0_seq1:402-836(+)